MNKTVLLSNLQLTALVTLRMLIGWHIFYEGISKLLNPVWSSLSFLRESKWIMKDFSNWIISNNEVLNAVDIINTWGLLAIGTSLILGLFSRTSAIVGSMLLLVYFVNSPPFIGLEYAIPSEGNYLIINKTLIEAVALLMLALFPTSAIVGLDYFFQKKKTTQLT